MYIIFVTAASYIDVAIVWSTQAACIHVLQEHSQIQGFELLIKFLTNAWQLYICMCFSCRIVENFCDIF